ncbi:hypothetical protein F7725_017836 [Dissostichus mawsoni]|uniref:Uncharacterized protein n=1 Tax=Dissostichus mawsoni TaxID=36200 RepID=A0A7J5XRC7_DISMA|nr:hypothetical protein F7725_017836 [Dissostichus mawsoni]
MFSYCSHLLIVWTLLFQIKSVNLVSLAGDSLSPAAMRSMTLLLLKNITEKYSPLSSGTNGYWVGLRVEDGKWNSFNADPVEGRCAISVLRENSWVSVSCGDHKQWICQQKALSLSVCTAQFVLPIAVCWIILLAIMGLRIYCEYLLDECQKQHLNAEIKTLTTQKDGLTKQIQEMETNWNELNVSRAQWSINDSWVDPPTEGHCALSVWHRTPWSSVSCEEKQQWICQKKALSFCGDEASQHKRLCWGKSDVQCSDWNIFDLRYNDKYFCRSPCTEDKHIIIKAASGKTTQQNRIQILNRGNDLFVTFTNLKNEEDGLDLLIKVNLKVTDAASYCSKRTPDTADTFTTLSSAVSNISTLSSNNKHNITDVSASNTTLNTPTHSAPATQAADEASQHKRLCWGKSDVQMLRLEHCVDVKSNDKYFCRSPCTEDKHIIIKAASGKTTQGNRIQILNRGNDLFVTFTNLKKSDANIYYCGVKRTGPDLYIKVNLKVTDAASYCSKKTPETADTFTTLSSAVSNISTLSSNSSDNITDVSASNTTTNTTTTTTPATQAAGSIPYLIIGVILIITILMVLLKFMSKKMMKQRSKTHKPTHIVYM